MQILIITGPHSKVREITLVVRHLVLGSALGLALAVGGNSLIGEFSNDTENLLHTVNHDSSPDQFRVTRSEGDYETKLLELQARVIEAERNLARLDDLRSQLAKSNGQVNLANNVIDLGNAQGGPMNPANVVINLGNQGEQYGARLDRAMQDTIALSTRIEGMQKSLTTTWGSANALPTGSPLALMPQTSSGLGYRQDPITGERSWHEGTDFPAPYGTPILATAEGVVLRAGWDPEYGYTVDIQHKNAVVTRYAHAQELVVKRGDFIKQSQMIAKVGSTGRSTGPHLHYEVLGQGIISSKN